MAISMFRASLGLLLKGRKEKYLRAMQEILLIFFAIN